MIPSDCQLGQFSSTSVQARVFRGFGTCGIGSVGKRWNLYIFIYFIFLWIPVL